MTPLEPQPAAKPEPRKAANLFDAPPESPAASVPTGTAAVVPGIAGGQPEIDGDEEVLRESYVQDEESDEAA